MSERFKPRNYQELIVNHVIKTPRAGVWAGMGLGKTASILLAIDRLSLVENVFPVLVLAPLRVAQNTWPEEIKKWTDFNHLRVSVIAGSATERRRALRTPADIYTINYENLPWLIESLKRSWPFALVIADESTRLKGFRLQKGTQRARALGRVAHMTKRFVELTGTPSPNGLQDLWGQMWFLDAGARLGRSFQAFSQRWFTKTFDGWGLVPNSNAQEEIQGKLKDICISLSAADYFDIKEPVKNILYVDMPHKVREMYKELEREMFVQISEEHNITAVNAAAKSMKCLQLANGAAYTDNSATNWAEVHDEKLRALGEIIEEAAGAPILVAYNFRSDAQRILKAFPRARMLDTYPKTIYSWNQGRIPILLAHPASAGHGLNLQDGGNILVFFGHNWNLEEHQQIIERIGPTRQAQAGHNRPVFIHHIVTRGTVDELVLERMRTKREVQDILLDAMKRRNTCTM